MTCRGRTGDKKHNEKECAVQRPHLLEKKKLSWKWEQESYLGSYQLTVNTKNKASDKILSCLSWLRREKKLFNLANISECQILRSSWVLLYSRKCPVLLLMAHKTLPVWICLCSPTCRSSRCSPSTVVPHSLIHLNQAFTFWLFPGIKSNGILLLLISCLSNQLCFSLWYIHLPLLPGSSPLGKTHAHLFIYM